jgi:hypothetical protein
VIAETGSTASPEPVSKRFTPVALGTPFIMKHDKRAHTWLQVRDVAPKNWIPGQTCPPEAVTGLKVGGPSATWPLRYFPLSPGVAYCFAYVIKANSGLVAPGP